MATKKQKEVKITENELSDLQKIVSSEQEVTMTLSKMCLEKEITLRFYNKSFDEKYDLLEMKNTSLVEKKNKMIEALNVKYGQGVTYNLRTGNIIKADE